MRSSIDIQGRTRSCFGLAGLAGCALALLALVAGCSDELLEGETGDAAATAELPATSALTISGKVFGENGAGVAGVTVTLSGKSNATRVTDAQGAYSFASLAAGSYSVRPSYQSCPFLPSVANFNSITSSRTQNFNRACSVEMRYRPVVLLVESDVRSRLSSELGTYVELIRSQFNVDVRLDSSRTWKSMNPAQIRDYIRSLYATQPIQGVILAGRIPYLLYEKFPGDGSSQYHIAPLYYEHFDAVYADTNGNGFPDTKYINANDATEIWSAWWLPPSGTGDATSVASQLRIFLNKSIAYHRGQNRGTGAFIGATTELGLAEHAIEFRNALVNAGGFSDAQVVDSNPTPSDYAGFVSGMHSRLWSHMHVVSHGLPEGFFFEAGAAYSTTSFDNDTLRALTNGANFITASGCLNGNLNGEWTSPTSNPGASLALRFVFDSLTPTLTFYGSTDPQSTGLYGDFHQPLYRGTRDAYAAMGYYDLRNSDVIWGTAHYLFRTVDDKSLAGDPFYHY